MIALSLSKEEETFFVCCLSLKKKKMKESKFVFILSVMILCVSLVSSEMKLGLEDYNIGVDPTPTTKHSVRGGTIEHGSPLNPYIPKPPPSSSSPPPLPQDGH